MKKLLGLLACVACVSALGQGTVQFQNRIPGILDAPVFAMDGTTKLGATYSVQLWAGPTGSAEGSLAAVGNPIAFLNLGTGAPSGYFNGGPVTIPGLTPSGSGAVVQVRAWLTASGTTWANAVAAGQAYGKSTLFNLASTGDPNASPPGTPVNLIGLTSFNLVPEPSTIALGVLGAAALLLRRRK